jgi:tRNA uridine 5-carboxymethylaminomethyl modification enzyme
MTALERYSVPILVLYQQEMKRVLENEDNLDIMQGMVDELIIEDNEVKGLSA